VALSGPHYVVTVATLTSSTKPRHYIIPLSTRRPPGLHILIQQRKQKINKSHDNCVHRAHRETLPPCDCNPNVVKSVSRPFVPRRTYKSNEVNQREAKGIVQLMPFLRSRVSKLNPFPPLPCSTTQLLPFISHRAQMIPTVLWVSRIVCRYHSPSASRPLGFASVHSSILKWMVGIQFLSRHCRMYLSIDFVIMICSISEVLFIHLLLD